MQPSVRALSQSLLRHQFRRPVSGVPKFYPTATRNPVNQIQPREITARLITDWIAFAFRRSVAAADRGPHRSSSPHGLPANRSHLHTWDPIQIHHTDLGTFDPTRASRQREEAVKRTVSNSPTIHVRHRHLLHHRYVPPLG